MTDWAILGGDPAPGDPAAIRRNARAWVTAAQDVREKGGALHRQSAALSTVWRDSDDADTFDVLLRGPLPLLAALAQTHIDAGAALTAYAAALEQAQQAALAVVGVAAAAHTTIDRHALELAVARPLVAAGTGPTPNPFDPGHDFAPSGAELAQQAQADLRTSQQQAASIAADLARVARAAIAVLEAATATLARQSGHTGVVPGVPAAGNMASSPAFRLYLQKFAVTHPLDMSGSAAQIARRWAALDPSLRVTYIADHPALVGGADGIPVVDRDRANRRRLPTMAADIKGRLAALGPKPLPTQLSDAASVIGPPNPEPLSHAVVDNTAPLAWQAEHDALVADLAGLQQIRARLADGSLPTAYLIDVRATGTGQAVLASGNPDAARNVAVYVPGTSNSLGNIAGSISRSDEMWRAAVAAGSAADMTAVVTWMGYQAPATIADAAKRHFADDAVTPLAHFLTGLRVTHPAGRSLTTLVGHSYGATAVAIAAAATPLDADNLVFVASPGSGVASSYDLHLTGVATAAMPGRVFSTASAADPIADVPGFIWADDPTHDSFHGTVFAADAHPDMAWYNGSDHSSYWDPGSSSLASMGLVIAGHGAAVPAR